MRISKIYSNSSIFLPVLFNINNENENYLNIIFAESKAPNDKNRDLHNLGKSIFIDLIDFTLLKGFTAHHFLYKHKNRFRECKFFIELYLNNGSYLTLCRGVEDNSKISIKFHNKPNQDFTNCDKEEWDHYNVAIENAKSIVDSHLNLSAIKPWDYRQGISYFLRTQNDYKDYFQISKFSKGEDAGWKPYIAHILGFDSHLLVDKYNIEEKIEQLSKEKDILKQNLLYDEKEYNKLNSIVTLKTEELEKIEKRLDSFDFSEDEIKINQTLAKNIEYNISVLNDKLYNVNFDLMQIDTDLKNKLSFNLENIKKIYEDAKLYFPDSLLNDYQSLIDFNKKITKERNNNLKVRKKELENTRNELINKLEELGEKRKSCIKILNGDNTLKKYKELQNNYSNEKAELINYQEQLKTLETVIRLNTQIVNLKSQKNDIENKINEAQLNPSGTYKSIVKDFSEIAKKVFNKLVILNIEVNGAGNLDFNISFKAEDSILGKDTSESEGNTYKKILCVLFDLAILRHYAKNEFYHFVYHDGIFESLEPRMKEKLLEVIRESVEKYNIQYIMTVIESDLPIDKDKQLIRFLPEEEVLILNDLGPDGRLFKMDEF